jgi:hypothetical protein
MLGDDPLLTLLVVEYRASPFWLALEIFSAWWLWPWLLLLAVGLAVYHLHS